MIPNDEENQCSSLACHELALKTFEDQSESLIAFAIDFRSLNTASIVHLASSVQKSMYVVHFLNALNLGRIWKVFPESYSATIWCASLFCIVLARLVAEMMEDPSPAITERHNALLANEVLVSGILRTDSHCSITKDGFGPGCSYWQVVFTASDWVLEGVDFPGLLCVVHLRFQNVFNM